MRIFRFGRSSLALAGTFCSLLFLPTIASSQIVPEGSVRGVIRDAQGAVLQDVAVMATSADAPLTYNATTDSNGTYRLLNVLPGTYTLRASHDGFKTEVRQNVRVRTGLNLGLDITLDVGNISEAVTIAADSPLIESRASGTGLNVSGEFQRSLPLSTRNNWYDFLRLLPSATNNDSIYYSSFYVNGADFHSHVIQMDGADIAAGVQSSMAYVYASSAILQDVQVKTSGTEASAPLGQGAVINVITQSGTNVLKGSADISIQRKNWSGNNNPGGTTSAYNLAQPEVALGGPIVRDRLWVFGSYRYGETKSGVSRTADQIAFLKGISPGFDVFDNEIASRQAFIKGTLRLSPAHTVQVFDQYGIDRLTTGAAADAGPFSHTDNGGNAVSASLQSFWSHALTSRVILTYNNQSNPTKLQSMDKPSIWVHKGIGTSAGVPVGTGVVAYLDNFSPGLAQDAPGRKLTISGDVTYFKQGWMGSHEFQAGVYLQPQRLYEFDFNYVNDGFATEEVVLRNPADPAGGYVPFHKTVYAVNSIVAANVNTQDYATYVQDAWKPSARVTINAGVRMDRIKRTDRIFGDTVQDTTAVGPRFGVNYVLTADTRNVVRANWSRIHDAVSVSAGTTAGTNSAAFTDYYDTDLDGTFDKTIFTPAVTSRTQNRIIDLNNFRQPHADEFSAGYTRQFPGQVSVDLNYVNRRYRDRVANIEVNGRYDGVKFVGYQNEAFSDIYQLTSNTYNWPVYNGITAQVAKESSHFQLLGSYTRQFRHIAGTWQPSDPGSFIQPDAFADDRGIGQLFRASRSSLSGTDLTGTSQWRDHVFRLNANVRAPFGVQVSSSYTFESGPWSGPVVMRLSAPDPQFGPSSVTLSNGRVVQNPLATTTRFAYATRGEGQVRLPAMHIWNLRVARDFHFSGVRWQPAVEILNLPNYAGQFDFLSGANQVYSPNYGKGTGFQAPRSAQLSLNVWF